jgi:hypothetical protein
VSGRAVAGHAVTGLAGALVLLALAAPNEAGQLTPGALLRLPVEALLGAVLLLLLPVRAGRAVALACGALLGVLTVVRALDMGFMTVLARPFDPVFDWTQLGAAGTFVATSTGPAGAVAVAVGAGLGAVALVVLTALAARRLGGLVVRHRRATARAVPVLAALWLACAVLGVQVVAPVPVAARSTAALAWRTAVQVPTSLAEHRAFTAQAAAPDPFAGRADLLGGLRGKDVVVAFVESYGRSALEHPELAPRIGPVLDTGTAGLDAAGFGSRSGWLTSPVAGGGSWLAHATFLSGLWVTTQQSHRDLVAGDRLTLTSAFAGTGRRTVGIMPGVLSAWPEAEFFGLDRVYGADDLGNRAQGFSGFRTPDQLTLSAFERLEHGRPGRGPLMAEIPMVTSHFPWTPLPPVLGWDAIGDGSVYDTLPAAGDPVDDVWSDPTRVRAAYARSVGYSLDSLVSWVRTYGDDDLVLVLVGDHQPAPVVTGPGAGRDVPVTVISRDRAVLDRIAGWRWAEGLTPGPGTPVWRMDAFRDRFLAAFDADPARFAPVR